MSAVDRVVDYMAGLPQAAEHAKTYATEFTERALRSSLVQVDGVEEEKRLLPKGEKEIIGRLNCPLKFTKKGMAVKFGLGVGVKGSGQVRRDEEISLDFLGSREWFLEPAKSRALYSAKESTIHLLDDAQKRQIMSKCPHLGGADIGDIYMTSVHERLSVPSDMRHIMCKMYLILQDYNLSVTSKSQEMFTTGSMAYSILHRATPQDRLAAVTNHDIVIDAEGFTPDELGLLCLAGEAYPSVWYGVDNMYTKCNMDPDDLVILSDERVEVNSSFLWGSPDRLYQMMWTIASKLNCVQSLISAIENMRGKCKMAADMFEHVKGNTISSMIPLSYNVETAFGGDIQRTIVSNMPGYVSSSMGLISDLLYGMSYKAVASCVGESLGACGTLVSSSTPRTNRVINGILRDYGLQHTSSEDNILLKNWEIVAGRPIMWEFGIYLKDYVLGLAQQIMVGLDIPMPQILLTIPSLRAVNTAFGMARGWRGPKHVLEASKTDRYMDTDGLASVAWLMGSRKVRPPVFYNRSGKKPLLLSHSEHYLQAQADGHLAIESVAFWLREELGGRTDENEQTSSDLYRTEYAGTNCSLIYNYAQDKWVTSERPPEPSRRTLKGQIGPDEATPLGLEAPLSPEEEKTTGLSGFGWGKRAKKPEDLFKHLTSINRAHSIVPSRRPRHNRVESSGEAVVGPYMLDGEEKNEMRRTKPVEAEVGDTIKVGRIQVPGDGQCGIHSLVEDLRTHGYMAANDVARAHSMFSEEVQSKSFHDIQEIAALAQKWGNNLDFLDVDSGQLFKYGTNADGHTVTIVRDGAHFSAGLLGEGKGQVTIRRVEKQTTPSDEFIRQVESYGNLFGSPSE